jgi:hypothetical protein
VFWSFKTILRKEKNQKDNILKRNKVAHMSLLVPLKKENLCLGKSLFKKLFQKCKSDYECMLIFEFEN